MKDIIYEKEVLIIITGSPMGKKIYDKVIDSGKKLENQQEDKVKIILLDFY